MEENESLNEQSHPLYRTDRDHIDRLLASESPSNGDFINLARLLLRYEAFPGAFDLRSDMAKILKLWEITQEELNARVKELWAKGYRPGNEDERIVGSGFDTSDANEN